MVAIIRLYAFNEQRGDHSEDANAVLQPRLALPSSIGTGRPLARPVCLLAFNDQKVGVLMKIRWRAESGDEPLWPSAAPLVMVVRTDVLRGWHLGSPVVARGVDSERLIALGLDVLTPGGQFALYHRIVTLPPDETHPRPRLSDSMGIFRVNVATGENERAGFEARPMEYPSGELAFGGSPDATSVVIAQNWSLPSEPKPDLSGLDGFEASKARIEWGSKLAASARLTISLATFDGATARELLTLNAQFGSASVDGTAIQWSPNARLVAIELNVPGNRRPWHSEVHVFDTTTWDVVAQYVNAGLAGSACWGPDSDRILLEHEVNTTWVQHLNGTRQPITVLPSARGKMMRDIRPLGMADNDHLLTLRLPEDRATIMRTSIADGTHEGLFAWTGEYAMYPVIAQMPPETWL